MCVNTRVVLVLFAMLTIIARFVLVHPDGVEILSHNAQEYVSFYEIN